MKQSKTTFFTGRNGRIVLRGMGKILIFYVFIENASKKIHFNESSKP